MWSLDCQLARSHCSCNIAQCSKACHKTEIKAPMTIQPVPPLRRSCLSVPGINQRALEKTRSLDCDVDIFDLEDSVSSERKAEARHTLSGFFEGTPPCLYERVIRINGLHTAERQDDLRLVAELQPDAVLLPKVESLAEIDSVAAFLKDASSEVRIWA